MIKKICEDFNPSWQLYVDRGLLISVAMLLGLGLVIMMSASIAVAERNYGNIYHFFNRQLVFLALGLVVGFLVYKIKTSVWQNMGAKLLPIVLLLLVLVLMPVIGKEVNGSHRWINLGPVSLQVSEMAKLIMIMYLSGYMVRHGKELSQSPSYKPLFVPLIVLGITDGLLMLEPDFGSVVVLTATGIALLFLGGVKFSRLILLFIGAIAVMIPLVMMGYRGARVTAFLDPWAYASGKAYQTVHALMAVGDGGWFGAGLGASIQKLFYLPEAHNDFIFAVLAEEFGFIGIVFTLFLYAWLVQRAFVIGFRADKAKLHYAAYLAYGIGFWIGFQVLFHIGVNLALLPPKGLTLPLISYGGSSLLITMIAIALLMRVHRDTQISRFGVSEKEAKKIKKKWLEKQIQQEEQAMQDDVVNSQQKALGPILITAGGTGGHVYPGLAVARALQAQDIPVIWMGTPNGLEARVIPEADIDMVYLSVSGLRGKGLLKLLAAPVQLVKALFQSLMIMRKVRPSAVLGMGGFVAGPGGLVASFMGTPVVIHEQNAIPGLTNKLLSGFSKKVLEGFPGTFEDRKNTVGIGNPVRKDIAELQDPRQRLGDRWGHVHVLVFGGSLGAQALNEVVPMALGELPLDKRPIVRHQAGKNKDEATTRIYEKMGAEADITPFIEDMAEAYEWADLVICRSGALTVAELAAAGLASILVPYPSAVDDHQTANAKYLSEQGAAILAPQSELTKESLSELLSELCGNRDKLIEMSIRARELAKPQATDEVAAICAELAGYDFNKDDFDKQNSNEKHTNIKFVETIDQGANYEAA